MASIMSYLLRCLITFKTYSSKLVVFGINDIERKKFRKVSLEQLMTEIYAPPELRLLYHFSNEPEMKEFLRLEKDEEFGFM